MMFGQVLRLIGAAVFVFSTFIFGATALKCESGGSCYLEYTWGQVVEFKFETKNCSDSCVYFKCFVGDDKIMEGAGCLGELVNTCKYVDLNLLKEIKSSYQDYFTYSHSLVLTSCNRRDGCAKEMFEKMISGGHRLLTGDFVFWPKFGMYYDRPKNGTCEYDNTPKQKLSQVKCETKGWCKSGGRFKYDLLKREVDSGERQRRPLFCDACARNGHMNDTYCEKCLFETKTCDACSKFLCTFDGKEIISGHGCFEDFERMCGVVMNETINNELSANQKNYFYSDKNVFMVTCSDSDDCHFDAFKKYPIVIPPTTTTMTTTESTTTRETSSSSTITTPLVTKIEPVSFESTSQQKEEEKDDINNLSVSVYSSFYLMCLLLMTLLFCNYIYL